jgi:hypothetical protein
LLATIEDEKFIKHFLEDKDFKNSAKYVRNKVWNERGNYGNIKKILESIIELSFNKSIENIERKELEEIEEMLDPGFIDAPFYLDNWLLYVLYSLKKGKDIDYIKKDGYNEFYKFIIMNFIDSLPFIKDLSEKYSIPIEDFREYEKSLKLINEEYKKQFIKKGLKRAIYSTFEVITVKGDNLKRIWYSFNPEEEHVKHVIKHYILFQEVINNLEFNPFVDGIKSNKYYRYEYQRLGIDPFELIINGKINSFDEIINLYKYYSIPFRNAIEYWEKAKIKAIKKCGFNNFDDVNKWLLS